MKSFKEFLEEKLITFGGKAYPNFGNVVIVGGGAGSGKGFQIDGLIGIQGKVLDVDHIKKLAIGSTKFAQRVKEETGHDIKNFDLKDSSDVFKIHEILSDVYGVTKGVEQAFFSNVLTADPERKPNIVFDVTLKDLTKLRSITSNVTELGYKKENIHIVWVVNDIAVAQKQNKERSRVVPEEILMGTHRGASTTMQDILSMGDSLKQYMDGDIYITFNKVDVDTSVEKSDQGGSYISVADYVKVKHKKKPQLNPNELSKRVLDKIREYTPKNQNW